MTGTRDAPTPAPPAPSIPLREFRVDGWLVQPALNRVIKGATAIRVRPQLIDMLGYFASRPGRVVSKTQLLADVWRDRFVSASGVARCVAELRQVLDDDARQPRIIETISKRGYRLIARVEPVEGGGAARQPIDSPDSTASPAVPLQDRRSGGSEDGSPQAEPDRQWWRQVMTAARAFLVSGLLTALMRHGPRDVLR